MEHFYSACQAVIHDELESPLHPVTIGELQWFFEHRRQSEAGEPLHPMTRGFLNVGYKVFGEPRFTELYHRWRRHGDTVFEGMSSPTIAEAAAYAWDRPRFDVGDTFEQADIFGVGVTYGYRLPLRLEVIGLGEFRREYYQPVRLRDSDMHELGGAVRWRGLGRLFSPEVGASSGSRTTGSVNENYDETEVYGRLRSQPVSGVYLSLRYRHRLRDYSTTNTAARNFGRRDRRQDITASMDITLMRRVVFNVYYPREEARSTRPGRGFVTNAVGTGLSTRF